MKQLLPWILAFAILLLWFNACINSMQEAPRFSANGWTCVQYTQGGWICESDEY